MSIAISWTRWSDIDVVQRERTFTGDANENGTMTKMYVRANLLISRKNRLLIAAYRRASSDGIDRPKRLIFR